MKKILTVEDDKEINRLICEYLSSLGYETLSVLNRLDAVRIVREQNDLHRFVISVLHAYQFTDKTCHYENYARRYLSDKQIIDRNYAEEKHLRPDF